MICKYINRVEKEKEREREARERKRHALDIDRYMNTYYVTVIAVLTYKLPQ